MIKKIFFCVALLLLALPMAMALNTTIIVHTLPAHDVTITLLEPIDTFSSIKSFPGLYSGLGGLASVSYGGDETVFHIKVLVKKDGGVVVNEQFDEQTAGEIIELDVYPEDFEVPEEEDEEKEKTSDEEDESSEDEEEEVLENEENLELEENQDEQNADADGITGLAVGKEENESEKSFPSWIIYLIGVILIAGIIGLVAMKGLHMKRPPHERGQVVEKDRREEDGSQISHDLVNAEEKIRRLQNEINMLKNQDKIKQIERRIEEEKEQIEKLRGSEEEED
jgi:hypothetical protein